MIYLIKKSLFIFSFHFIATCTLAQQPQSDSLRMIVSEIESSNIYEMSYTVGYAGTVSKQYQRFKQLLHLASDTTLSQLAINHQNTVVRLYAFQALKKRLRIIPEYIMKHFTNDHTLVKTLWGCTAGSKMVSALVKQNLKLNGL